MADFTLDGKAPVNEDELQMLFELANHPTGALCGLEKRLLATILRERDAAVRTRDEMDTAAQHRAERSVKEKRAAKRELVEALSALRDIHARAKEWNNVPACSDIEHLAAVALRMEGGER